VNRYVLKEYKLDCLLDGTEEVLRRIRLIEEISRSYDFIPETSFEIKPPRLLYKQQRLKNNSLRTLNTGYKLALLRMFAQDLDALGKTGFVHGDINRKNIIFDNSKMHLVDLEPSLKQMKEGIIAYMCTVPYISSNDAREKLLSIETDKIGFYFLVRQMLGICEKEKSLLKSARLRRNSVDFYFNGMEEIRTARSFSHIFKEASKVGMNAYSF
jgi:hypothetical protein